MKGHAVKVIGGRPALVSAVRDLHTSTWFLTLTSRLAAAVMPATAGICRVLAAIERLQGSAAVAEHPDTI